MDGTLLSRENSQIFNFAAVPNSIPSKAFREASQHYQLDYVKNVDISRKKENQSMAKNQHQMSNGSYILHNYLEKEGGTDGMQQKCYQNNNSYDNYGSKGFSGQEQEHVGQLKFINNVHNSALTLDKVNNSFLYPLVILSVVSFAFLDHIICLLLQGHLLDNQGNSKASEIASRDDLNTSTTFRRSIHPQFEEVTAPTR